MTRELAGPQPAPADITAQQALSQFNGKDAGEGIVLSRGRADVAAQEGLELFPCRPRPASCSTGRREALTDKVLVSASG